MVNEAEHRSTMRGKKRCTCIILESADLRGEESGAGWGLGNMRISYRNKEK